MRSARPLILGSVTVPAILRSALHSLLIPSPVTISRLRALTSRSSRQGESRRATGRSSAGRLISRTASRGTWAAAVTLPRRKLPLTRSTLPEMLPFSPSERIATGPVTCALMSSRSSNCAALASSAMSIPKPLGPGEVERRPAGHRAAALGGSGEAVEDQPRAAEPARGPDIVDHHAGDGALDPGPLGPAASRGSAGWRACRARRRRPRPGRRRRAARPRSAATRCRPARCSEAGRTAARGAQPLADIAAPADRREPRLRSADRPAVADRDRAQRRIAAGELRDQADVDRPRREDEARPGEAADRADWRRRSARRPLPKR